MRFSAVRFLSISSILVLLAGCCCCLYFAPKVWIETHNGSINLN